MMTRTVVVLATLGLLLTAVQHSAADQYVFTRAVGGPDSVPVQLNGPKGVAVDPSGNIWVADTGQSRIVEFSSSGAYLTQFGNAGGDGQLWGPRGVAVDPSGNVWVADEGNNRIAEFSPVPEPATLSLLALGGLIMVRLRRK